MKNKKKKGKNYRKLLLIFSILLFIGSVGFILYYLVLQPSYSKHINDKYRDLYYSYAPSENDSVLDDSNDVAENTENSTQSMEETTGISIELQDTKKGQRDSEGRLMKFSKLIEYNKDVKGWLSIDSTDIDYPVMQPADGSDYYLTRDFEGTTDKNGCLYIDGNCNVETPSKNIVIHGHNMESTKMMFYELPNYTKLDYFVEHPIITFDSIYQENKWVVFAVMRIAGTVGKNYGFNYMTGDFTDSEDFMDFVYQLQVRSIYDSPIKINENDSLLMLSTCSYEINDFRTVVIARQLRKDETADVDLSGTYIKDSVLYPSAWYPQYGGDAPVVTTFADAMSYEEINWYDGELTYESPIGNTFTKENLKYKITSNTTVSLVGIEKSNIKELSIPSTVTLYERPFEVTKIAKGVFKNLTKLEEVKLGKHITAIPDKAFINCSKLKSIVIGEGVESIGSKAFYNLDKLKNIKIKSNCLSDIDDSSFEGIHNKAKFSINIEIYSDFKDILKDFYEGNSWSYSKIN